MNDAGKRLLLLERKKAILGARSGLINFARYMRPSTEARADARLSSYQVARHHKIIAAALEEVAAGRIKRLMISCPPRHGKTLLSSMSFPAWYAGLNPGKSVVVGTYNDIYATDLGRGVLNLMRSPLYNHVFPDCKMAYGGKNVTRLRTTQGGDLFFVGVGGTLTGRGGDINLIDDPIKNRKEADSPIIREALWNWYTTVFRTRLMTKDAALVLIMTRWNEDDLIGRHIDPANPFYNVEEAESWRIINLPALAEDDDPMEREPGAALWPERFDEEFLHNMRRNDPRGFTALYQGRPTPLDGSFFRRDHIRTYNKMSDMPAKEGMRFYCASDHAVAMKQENDKTCLMAVGVDENDNIWIMPDLIWTRMPTDMAVDAMLRMMDNYKPMFWWAEKGVISKSIGPFLRKRMLEKRIFCSIDEITATADKQQRAQAIQARMSMGRVYFPSFARWHSDAVDQLLKFPHGTFDDFVDTLALIGLGLVKQRPARQIKMIQKGPEPFTLGWIKANTKRNERENALSGW